MKFGYHLMFPTAVHFRKFCKDFSLYTKLSFTKRLYQPRISALPDGFLKYVRQKCHTTVLRYRI
jgi:hypothetical protein